MKPPKADPRCHLGALQLDILDTLSRAPAAISYQDIADDLGHNRLHLYSPVIRLRGLELVEAVDLSRKGSRVYHGQVWVLFRITDKGRRLLAEKLRGGRLPGVQRRRRAQ